MDTSLLQQLASSQAAMEMIYTIVWIVGIVSFLVFIALFGRLPVFRKTPIGWTHRLLVVRLPAGLIHLDAILTNRRITNSVTRTYRYLLYDRHPVVLLIFVSLQAGSEILFLPPASSYLQASHRYVLIPLLIINPYLWLYLSYSASSHHITEQSYSAALRRYPYDYTLYHPHQGCRSCSQRPKPARSKHCSICKTCIERQDHHCIWVNNCVGLHNYGYFVALLISTACLLGYGAYTGLRILETILQDAFVPHHITAGSFTSKKWSTSLSWGEWLNVYSVAIATNARLGATTLLACMTFPLSLGFLVYHVYLIWAGTTTNETAKWSDLREDIWDNLVWKARIADVSADYPGPLSEEIVYDPEHHRDKSRMNGRKPSWPDGEAREAKWWIIRTRGGTNPTRWKIVGEGQHEQVVDDRWVKVTSLKTIENLYDLGVWRNAKDALLRAWKES